ncbi:hypothetical protein [Nonomuraea turkmeniaca]|uniref:hypothetical protein n=1 Tax=Nonomuraea turkmeniaca TaxID=103838 RepID=UPI0014777D72|nr:hypothetical protein [Nonomuraea turkmeniaca]
MPRPQVKALAGYRQGESDLLLREGVTYSGRKLTPLPPRDGPGPGQVAGPWH